MHRRSLVFRLAAALPAAAAGVVPARAQPTTWPDRPVRVIVPFPPGGAIDAIARLLAPRLSDAFGRPAVVENRGGAGGTIGTAAAAQSTDGHTLLMVSLAHAVNPALYPRLPYDAASFAAVAPVAVVPNLLVVPAASGARDVRGLVEGARRRPGEVTYGSAGNGTSIHLAGALFCAMAGVEMAHVPYRGTGPAVADLVAGRIGCMFDSVTSAAPHLAAGRLRALAVTTGRRIAAFPDVPTVAEAGPLPGYAVDPWFALLAPRSLPAEARARTGAAVAEAMRDPASRERFAAIGAEPMGGDAASLDRLIADDTAKWGDLVRRLGIRPD